MSFRIKPQPCPHCGGRCDHASDPEHPNRTEFTRPNELGVCFHCLTAIAIAEDGTLRPADLSQYPAPELFKLLAIQQQIIHRRRRERHARN